MSQVDCCITAEIVFGQTIVLFLGTTVFYLLLT